MVWKRKFAKRKNVFNPSLMSNGQFLGGQSGCHGVSFERQRNRAFPLWGGRRQDYTCKVLFILIMKIIISIIIIISNINIIKPLIWNFAAWYLIVFWAREWKANIIIIIIPIIMQILNMENFAAWFPIELSGKCLLSLVKSSWWKVAQRHLISIFDTWWFLQFHGRTKNFWISDFFF